MKTISIRNSMIGGGVTSQNNRSVTMDNIITASETLAAGKSGTAGAAGVMTLGSSHGFTDASVVSVWWATGFRWGCTVTAYDGTTITVNGSTGTGDSLPTSGAVIVAAGVEIDAAFSGSALAALSMGADVDTLISLEDAGGSELAKAIPANEAYQWDSGNGEANPVTGDSIIKAVVYNKEAEAGEASVLIGYDNA